MNNDNKSMKRNMNIFVNVAFDIYKRIQIIIFISVLFAVCFDTFKTITYQPIYQSEATFAVKANSSSNTTTDGDIGESFKYIFQSNVFKKKIEEHLDVESLNGTYSASIVNNTSVLHVSATSPSSKCAYDMMIALKENYKEISNLVVGSSNIDVLQDVSVPTTPINQINHVKNLVLMGGVGFVLSSAFFGALSFLRDTIKYKDEIQTKLSLRLIGDLPKESKVIDIKKMKKKKAILISQFSTSFHYVESMKRIRSYIEKYCKKHHARVLMTTSSLENEGKSSVAVNLGISLALSGHKVLLIDGDLRKSSLHLILEQKKQKYDIKDVLENDIPVQEAIMHLERYGVDVLFGFDLVEDSNKAINSREMEEMMHTVRDLYDYVIVDSAPSRYLSDSRMMAHYMDGIILVVKQNFANISTILTSIEKLSLSKTPIIGCINNQSFSMGIGSGKYYGSRYGYHYYHRRKESEE